MRVPKIYLETTVFNYYFDTDRDAHTDTVKLFDEIKAGKYEVFTSIYVMDELAKAGEPKRSNMLELIEKYDIIVVPADEETEKLADIYINEKVIPTSKQLDSLHIACASVNDVDYIFSFNFRHINRIKTKEMTSIINIREGYKPVKITVPAEVIEYDES